MSRLKHLGWLASLLILLPACDRGDREDAVDFPTPSSLPAIQADVSTESPGLGEPIEVEIRVSAEERIVLPPVGDWLNPSLRVLNRKSTTEETEGLWTQRHHLTVGLYAITNTTLFAEADLNTLSDPPRTLELPFISLGIQPRLEEDAVPRLGNTDLPDFRGPEALARRRRNLWIGLAAAILLLALGVWLAIRLSRKPKPAPPPIARHVLALRNMDRLEQSEIWTRPDSDACAVQLSLILRRYIEGQFTIHAPERTTEEFLHEVAEDRPWSEDAQKGLAGFFHQTDRIKFAGERPEREVLEDLMREARRFVQATAPVERTEGAAA